MVPLKTMEELYSEIGGVPRYVLQKPMSFVMAKLRFEENQYTDFYATP